VFGNGNILDYKTSVTLYHFIEAFDSKIARYDIRTSGAPGIYIYINTIKQQQQFLHILMSSLLHTASSEHNHHCHHTGLQYINCDNGLEWIHGIRQEG